MSVMIYTRLRPHFSGTGDPMKLLNRLKATALVALLSMTALPAFAQSLTTTYLGGNNFAGNTFDLTANTDLTVNSFDVHLRAGSSSTADVEIYWREGTSNGYEGSSQGWTLLGTATVAIQGVGNPTPVPIGGLQLRAGRTYGVYVNIANHGGFSSDVVYLIYSNGASQYANADLVLTSSKGKSTPVFVGETFNQRIWNGTVHYTLGINAATTCASEGYTGTKLSWCKNICEMGYTGATLDSWIHRWVSRYRDLPYCAAPASPPA